MRRAILLFVVLFVLVSARSYAAEGEEKAETKPKRYQGKMHHLHHKVAKCDKGEATGPFADVPKGHWTYGAVQRAAESGILQGWDNRFHGNKVVNRYQMAVVVARMLDRVGVLKANGKVITAQDIANLESLTIEFADELAFLNVKVSTLEDTVAGLKKDIDMIKADLCGVGARAGITGMMEVRYVFTDNGSAQWTPGLYSAPASMFTYGDVTYPVFLGGGGATTGITRYVGGGASGAIDFNFYDEVNRGKQFKYDSRDFLTVSNFAINVDREFDRKVHFHSQISINAEGSRDCRGETYGSGFNTCGNGNGVFLGTSDNGQGVFDLKGSFPLAGRGSEFFYTGCNIDINEAYVVFDDWFTDGVSGRLGIWAVPMNTEVNGPSRTYRWTITPSIANSKWESLRPVGLDIFQHNDKEELVFYVGFFTPGDTASGLYRSGTLLSAPTAFSYFDPDIDTNIDHHWCWVQVDGRPNPGNTDTRSWGLGRFPTPMGYAAMTDAARGVTGQTLSDGDIGFYAMIGTHPTNKAHTGLTWHLAYYDRNGNIRASMTDHIGRTDWDAWQAAFNYQWQKFMFGMQYYDARSKNYNLQDFIYDPTKTTGDSRWLNTTPFANVGGLDTVSQSWMAIANWQFNKHGSLTVRYEDAQDKTGLAKIEAEVWTLATNYKTSNHGMLQLEWINPRTKSVSENGFANTSDIHDDLVQLNYKLNW